MVGIVLVDVVPDLRPEPVWKFLDQASLLPDAEQIAAEILTAAPSLHRAMEHFAGHMALVRAERSAMTPDDVERFRQARPEALVVDVPGAGHLVARDRPSELAAILAETVAGWLVPMDDTITRRETTP